MCVSASILSSRCLSVTCPSSVPTAGTCSTSLVHTNMYIPIIIVLLHVSSATHNSPNLLQAISSSTGGPECTDHEVPEHSECCQPTAPASTHGQGRRSIVAKLPCSYLTTHTHSPQLSLHWRGCGSPQGQLISKLQQLSCPAVHNSHSHS